MVENLNECTVIVIYTKRELLCNLEATKASKATLPERSRGTEIIK